MEQLLSPLDLRKIELTNLENQLKIEETVIECLMIHIDAGAPTTNYNINRTLLLIADAKKNKLKNLIEEVKQVITNYQESVDFTS